MPPTCPTAPACSPPGRTCAWRQRSGSRRTPCARSWAASSGASSPGRRRWMSGRRPAWRRWARGCRLPSARSRTSRPPRTARFADGIRPRRSRLPAWRARPRARTTRPRACSARSTGSPARRPTTTRATRRTARRSRCRRSPPRWSPERPGSICPERDNDAVPERRVIAHCDIDAFYASVELLRHPELADKPLIVAGTGPRSVVTTASYEARRFGVDSAMPAARARALCPQGVFIAPDHAAYREKSIEVWDLVRARIDRVQQVGIDEGYVDVTEFARPMRVLRELVAEIEARTGMVMSVGVGPSKLVAK